MPGTRRRKLLTLHVLERPQPGAWCSTCQMPSAFLVRYTLSVGGGVPGGVLSTVACPTCLEWEPA